MREYGPEPGDKDFESIVSQKSQLITNWGNSGLEVCYAKSFIATKLVEQWLKTKGIHNHGYLNIDDNRVTIISSQKSYRNLDGEWVLTREHMAEGEALRRLLEKNGMQAVVESKKSEGLSWTEVILEEGALTRMLSDIGLKEGIDHAKRIKQERSNISGTRRPGT